MENKIRLNLEALRGFAALFVVLNHIEALHNVFDPNYLPALTVAFAPSGHLCVLVFFALSGYVIAASNQQLKNITQIKTYIKKRFLRIYPVYFIAMIFTLLVARENHSVYFIVCNFALLQVLLVPPFFENGPGWSLNHEVFYYLVFIPVSFCRVNSFIILLGAIICGLLNYFFYPNVHTPIISCYLFGFSFWIGGVCIARFFSNEEKKVPYTILLSTLFLLLSIDQLLHKSGATEFFDRVSYVIFNKHLLYPNIESSKIIISYHDLAFLPYCLYFIIIFAGYKFKFEKVCFVVLQLPVLYALIIIATTKHQPHFLSLMVPVTYYIISLLLWFTNFDFVAKIGEKLMNFGSWLGGISYSIYIVHAPLIFMLGRIRFFDNNLLSYVTKLIVFALLVLILAYLLEKKYQPWIRRYFVKSKEVQI